jgi:uncharacterized membrane protein YhaH (DUF805 family)
LPAVLPSIKWIATFFLSFRGRISRKSWWFGDVFIQTVGIASYLAVHGWPDVKTESLADLYIEPPSALVMAWSVVLLIPSLAISVKRLNDRDHPVWVGAVFVLLTWAWIVPTTFGYVLNRCKWVRSSEQCSVPR